MDSAVFAQLAERCPMPIVVCRSAPFEILWASNVGDANLRAQLSEPELVARWEAACDDAHARVDGVEVELPLSATIVRRAKAVALDDSRVAFYFDAVLTSQLAREDQRRFELLFSQNIHAVFFTRFDTPVHWPAAREAQDEVLAYLFEHQRVTAINDVMCRQMAAPRETVVGSTPSKRWNGNYPQWREHMRMLFDQGFTYHSLRAPTGNGTWLDVEGEYICTYDDEGRLTGHCGIQRDITQKREAITRARKSRERLELAILGADIVVWEYDVDTQRLAYELPSPQWVSQLDLSDREWSIDYWQSIIHPDDRESVASTFRNHLARRTSHFRSEYRVRTRSGGWLWLLCTGRIAHVDPTRMAGIAVDITEHKALFARVYASERLAALGTLAAGVGHEINNPLTYLGLSLELLERRLAALPIDASSLLSLDTHVKSALFGAKRVGAIVRDLQWLARPRDVENGPTQPVEVIERCVKITEHQIHGRARLQLDLASVPEIRISPDRLAQVLLNLLANSIQSIPEGANDRNVISIVTRHDGDRVAISVGDTGSGIAPELLDRIFEPFFTTKDIGRGTGLGLSICRSIVTELGGQIEVASEPDRGTTVTVALPAAER